MASVTVAVDRVAIAVNEVSFREVAYFNELMGGPLELHWLERIR